MKDKRKRKALEEYEGTMREAADVRRFAIGEANDVYNETKRQAKVKYRADMKEIKESK